MGVLNDRVEHTREEMRFYDTFVVDAKQMSNHIYRIVLDTELARGFCSTKITAEQQQHPTKRSGKKVH